MESEARTGRVARATDRVFHLALHASLENHLLSEVPDAFWAAVGTPEPPAPSTTRSSKRSPRQTARAVRAMRTHFDGIRTRLDTPGTPSLSGMRRLPGPVRYRVPAPYR